MLGKRPGTWAQQSIPVSLAIQTILWLASPLQQPVLCTWDCLQSVPGCPAPCSWHRYSSQGGSLRKPSSALTYLRLSQVVGEQLVMAQGSGTDSGLLTILQPNMLQNMMVTFYFPHLFPHSPSTSTYPSSFLSTRNFPSNPDTS